MRLLLRTRRLLAPRQLLGQLRCEVGDKSDRSSEGSSSDQDSCATGFYLLLVRRVLGVIDIFRSTPSTTFSALAALGILLLT